MLLSGTLAIQIRGSSDPRMHQMSGSDGSDQHASIWQFLSLQHSQAASSSTKVPAIFLPLEPAYMTICIVLNICVNPRGHGFWQRYR